MQMLSLKNAPCAFNLTIMLPDMFLFFSLLITAYGNVFQLLFGMAASADLKIIIVCAPEDQGSNSLWKMRHASI